MSGANGLEERILEELIYERVRVSVDMCALIEFEQDLAASIERALRQCGQSAAERSDLAMTFLQRAWQRVGEEVLGELAASELGTASRALIDPPERPPDP